MSSLVDQFGRKVNLKALEKPVATPVSIGETRKVWGYDSQASGLSPETLGSILAAADDGDLTAYLTLAEEMEEREPHYRAVLSTRKLALTGLDVNIESPSDDPKDLEITDFVSSVVSRPEFAELVEDMADALGKGFSICEIMWQHGEKWIPREYIWRDPRWFKFDKETGTELRLIDERDKENGLALDPWKYVIHKPKLKSGLPQRAGLARVAAAPYVLKSYSIKDWWAFAERYGMPTIMGKYPSESEPDAIQALLRAIMRIGTAPSVAYPDSTSIEFAQAVQAPGGDALFRGMVEYLDGQTSKGILGQTMTTDNGSSYGQGQVHNEVRWDYARSDAKQAARTLTRYLVIPLVEINYGPRLAYPRVVIAPDATEDLDVYTRSLSRMIDRKLRVEASEVRDKFKLSEPAEGAELLEPAKSGGSGDASVAVNRRDSGNAAGRVAVTRESDALPKQTMDLKQAEFNQALMVALNRASQNTDVIESLTNASLQNWQKLVEPISSPVRDLAKQCTSYDQFVRELNALLDSDELDASGLVHSLALATWKARAIGNVSDET